MIRQYDREAREMIAGSGIFTREELRTPHRRHHSAVIDKLTKHQAAEPPFAAPILAYQTEEKP
jgi:hypothetical protein